MKKTQFILIIMMLSLLNTNQNIIVFKDNNNQKNNKNTQEYSQKSLDNPAGNLNEKIDQNNESLENISYYWKPYQNLTNGLIEKKNGTNEFRAIVTTKPQRLSNLNYYNLEKINSNTYWVTSVYGKWQINRSQGVVLLNKNTNRTIFDSEYWFGMNNGNVFPAQSISFELLEKNSDNLTLRRVYDYGLTNGYLNITYSWVKGALKITTLLFSAKNLSNIRIGLNITGLDQFSKRDLFTYNTTNRYLDFSDMLSFIDNTSSSFQQGILSLISKSFSISAGQTKSLDPSFYEVNDINDFYVVENGGYTAVNNSDQFHAGKHTASELWRSFLNFDLSFIGKNAIISHANLTMMYVETISSTTVWINTTNVLYEPYDETNAYTNPTLVFSDQLIENDSSSSITYDANGTFNTTQSVNITNNVRYWVGNRNQSVSRIGLRLRAGNESKLIHAKYWDAQSGVYGSNLNITWTTDTTPPVIYTNISTDWVNNNDILITTYDQPASNPSGLNLSTLAYSINGSDWIKVPVSQVTWTNNSANFNTEIIDGKGTMAFRMADLSGNWGYSNSSFGKQYYPRFTGNYAFENTTQQLGWGDDWTESITDWTFNPTHTSGSFSLDSGLFGNSIKIEADPVSSNVIFRLSNLADNIESYSQIKFYAKANISLDVRSCCGIVLYLPDLSNRIEITDNAFSIDPITTNWQEIIVQINSTLFQNTYGSPDFSNLGIIEFSFTETNNVTIWIDGLHFENKDGDSATESVSNDFGDWKSQTIYYANATANTDSYKGYESIDFIIGGSSVNYNPIFDFGNSIDASQFDIIEFYMKSNVSFTFNNFRISSDPTNIDDNYAYYSDSFSIGTSWTRVNYTLSNYNSVLNNWNQSQIYFLRLRNVWANMELQIDGLNFYQSNQSFAFDTIGPTLTLDSLTDQLPANPFDNIYINSTNHIFYSNDQTMNNYFTVGLITSDESSGLAFLNASYVFGQDQNQSYNSASTTLTYYINENEDNTTLIIELYDNAGNSASLQLNFTIDNISPSTFTMNLPLSQVYGQCVPLNITEITDSSSGFAGLSITIGIIESNSTINSGLVVTCGIPIGSYPISAIAWDNVANYVSANNSDQLFVTVEGIQGFNSIQIILGQDLEFDFVNELINFVLFNGNSLIILSIFITLPMLFYVIYKRGGKF